MVSFCSIKALGDCDISQNKDAVKKKKLSIINEQKCVESTKDAVLAIAEDIEAVNDHHISDPSNNSYDSYSISQLQNALLNLEKKYADLRRVGVLEAEKRFDEYKNAAEMQMQDYQLMFQKMEDKISLLEKSSINTMSQEDLELEIAAVKEQEKAAFLENIHSAQGKWQAEKELLLEQVNVSKTHQEELNKQLETFRHQLEVQTKSVQGNDDAGLVKFYEGVSGLSILSVQKDDETKDVTIYSCSLKGKNGGKSN